MIFSDVLQRCRPFPATPLYVVGVGARGVTVRSQQRRAIQVVDALLGDGVASAGGQIMVVGAGAAGLTAAVRASRAGCRVVVLERESETLATLRGSHGRLLHPNLYSWPSPNWSNDDAELPIMSWKAAVASRVASDLDAGFRQEVQRSGLIELRTLATSLVTSPLAMSGPLIRWRWRDVRGEHEDLFSAVVVAVGFGREPRTGPRSAFPGYWDDDYLSQVVGPACLIQGAGDGGLTDALRLRINSFDQGRTIAALLQEPEAVGLADEVESIERLSAAAMDAAYRELKTAWLETAIRRLGLRPTSVTIVDRRPPFGPGRFPLNKLLASRLLRMGELRFCQVGDGFEVPDPTPDHRHPPISIEGTLESFDVVLIRVGRGRAVAQLAPQLELACEAMVIQGIDPAELPIATPPVKGTALIALANAATRSQRVADLFETLFLFLRHCGFDSEELAQQSRFDSLRVQALAGLRVHPIAVNHAPYVCGFAHDWLRRAHESGVVAARALLEALDASFGDQVLRALHGPRSKSPQARR